jgi:Ca-activated chloride channel homolog
MNGDIMKTLIIILSLSLSLIVASCVGGDDSADDGNNSNGYNNLNNPNNVNNVNNVNNWVNNINNTNNVSVNNSNNDINNLNNVNNTSGTTNNGDPLTPEEIQELLCEDATSVETIFYMSADDSASQAQPVYLRHLSEVGNLYINSSAPREYEFLNYYTFDYEPAPMGQLRIEPELEYDDNTGEYKLLVGVVSHEILSSSRRPFNFTFSVDSSGSMSGDAIDNVRHSLRAVASQLKEGDVVSIVHWSLTQTVPLNGHVITGPNDQVLLDVINNIRANGGTDLHGGLIAAYDIAKENYSNEKLNRVFLLSDGGANAGITDENLIAQSTQYEESEGIFMIGVGTDTSNYNHELMDTVTDVGKGAYLYIPNQGEAEKMFTGSRLLSNVEVAALNVRLEVTLPANFVISEFHGEEISQVASEVKQQHLAPNDSMMYHSNLLLCVDGNGEDQGTFSFKVTWTNPATMIPQEYEISATSSDLLSAEKVNLEKATILVEYSRLITNADNLFSAAWQETKTALLGRIEAFYTLTEDPELLEIKDVLNRVSL